jgi:hypothetical protein
MNATGPRTFLLLFCAFLFNSAPVRSQDLAIRGPVHLCNRRRLRLPYRA